MIDPKTPETEEKGRQGPKGANPNRKAVMCSPTLVKKIAEFIGPDKDFFNFSDFTLCACRHVLELNFIQETEMTRIQMVKELFGKDTEPNLPFEPLTFQLEDNDTAPKEKTLVTFPEKLLKDLARVAYSNEITIPAAVRYCLDYYCRQFTIRKESDADVDRILEEAIHEAYRSRVKQLRPGPQFTENGDSENNN